MGKDEESSGSTDHVAKKREQNAEYRRRAKERREAEPELREAWLQRKREEAKRYSARKKQKEQRRKREVQRVKAWVDANPERAAETKRRWAENNRDKIRAAQLAYYYRHRDARLEAMRDRNAVRRADPRGREKQRQYRAQNRDRLNAQQREKRSTPGGREKHLADERGRRQREKRRRELGLPPRRRHRATINERTRNDAAADEFFSRRRTKADLRHLEAELRDVTAHKAAAEYRAATTSRRATAIAVRTDYESEQELERFQRSPASARLREEVRMDSIARQLRGLAPYADLDVEVERRAVLIVAAGRADAASSARTREASQRSADTTSQRLQSNEQGHSPQGRAPLFASAGRTL